MSTPLGTVFYLFDVFSVVAFAVSGALVASRKRLDVMGFMWLAVVTGVGGGTVRDVILMHFIAPLVESRYTTVLWFDAFGLGLVSVAGTVKALDAGAPALVAIAMGTVTGCVGGIIRDTLGQVPSILLRQEIYVTASALGACMYAGLSALGAGRPASMITAFLTTFILRGLAITFGWSLPVFQPRSERAADRAES